MMPRLPVTTCHVFNSRLSKFRHCRPMNLGPSTQSRSQQCLPGVPVFSFFEDLNVDTELQSTEAQLLDEFDAMKGNKHTV